MKLSLLSFHFPLNFLPTELGIVVLCPSQLVERAVQQYMSEKNALEAALISSQDEETPVISGRDNDMEEKEESSELTKGDIDNEGESPVIEEENQDKAENEEEKEDDGESGEDTTEQVISQQLPPYFSEVSVVLHQYTSDGYCCIEQLSVMGALGCRAFLSLSRGDQISDQITVDIIAESLRYSCTTT